MQRFFRTLARHQDLFALAAILVVVIIPRLPFLNRGLAFNDSSWFFHYGHRVLRGEVPYRDFVFQVGPLPMYVDAAFQAVFGHELVASLYAAVAIHVIRVWMVWLVARRLSRNWVATGLLVVFCALDALFGWAHHWSWCYAQLSLVACLYGFALSAEARSARPQLGWLVFAGAQAGLTIASRQATTVMLGILLLVGCASLLLRGLLSRRQVLAIAAGFVLAIILVFAVLTLLGAGGPALQQMLLDAPEKKGVSAVRSILDAFSGGALVLHGMSTWTAVTTYLLAPIAIAMTSVVLVSRVGAKWSSRVVGLLLVPTAISIGMVARYAPIEVNDVPRLFFTIGFAIVVLSPARFAEWFGISPVLALALTALPLASDWALEMSYPGRGWTDAASLIVFAVFLVLASSRVSQRAKIALCGGLAAASMLHVRALLHQDLHPFAHEGAVVGYLHETQFESDAPGMHGLRTSRSRRDAVAWLRRQVPAGSTCFLYGTDSALYDVLECTNPTRIDTTIPDFVTMRDSREALATLRANPPDFLISQETSFLNVPLTERDAHWSFWSDMNQKAGVFIHDSLRELLQQYEEVGLVADVLGPDLATEAARGWDNLQSIRLYRRKR